MRAHTLRRRRLAPAARSILYPLLVAGIAASACFVPATALAAESPHASLMSGDAGCAVCHGRAGGSPLFAHGTTSTVGPVDDSACVACHILGLGPAAAPQVYGGDADRYLRPDGSGHNDRSQVTCTSCHTIHGPAVGAPALAGASLKPLGYQPEAVAACDLTAAGHDEALAVWCTGCHADWPVPIGADESADARSVFGATIGHPFGAAGASSSRPCRSCASCHAARGFPHDAPGADAGLVGASSAASPRTGVSDRASDGVCLACHRDGSAARTSGVGISY